MTRELRRRRFLRLLTASAAATGLAACAEAREPGRAVVIGAGLAGLTTAYELEQRGWEVTVLEARARVGGRVFTLRDFASGQRAEAGASFIDAAHVHLQVHHYVDLFGLTLEDSFYDDHEDLYLLDGMAIPAAEEATIGAEVLGDIDRYWDEIEALAAALSDVDDPAAGAMAEAMDGRSAADWLDELALHPTARLLVDHGIRGEYDEPARISLLFLVQQTAVYLDVEEDDFELYRIAGGNSSLPEAFAAALTGAIELGAPVTAIRRDEQGVVVTYRDGETIAADIAIITVPPAALGEVAFTPALPQALQDAIGGGLNYATHTKVLLQYSRRLWLEEGRSGVVLDASGALGWVWEATNAQSGDAGILITFTSGDFGDALAAMSRDDQIEFSASRVDAIFPGSRDLLVDARPVVWVNEPFSRGAYSAFGVGQLGAFWTALRTPVDRLYFAGEHTDAFTGFMEGAIRSGQRVVREITGADVVGADQARARALATIDATRSTRHGGQRVKPGRIVRTRARSRAGAREAAE